MSVYQVTARRWAHGWELHIHDDAGDEIGVTQSRSLAGAKRMVCDYLALDLGGEPECYDVTITPELDGTSPPKLRLRGGLSGTLSKPSATPRLGNAPRPVTSRNPA